MPHKRALVGSRPVQVGRQALMVDLPVLLAGEAKKATTV